MKNVFFCLFLILSTLTFSQNKSSFKAFLDHKQFYHPEIGNLLEIHIQFIAYSLSFKNTEEGLQSLVGIQYKLINEKNEIVNSDAYQLKSPVMRDSIIEDFYELKRVALKPGLYKLDLILTDLNTTNEPIQTFQEIKIDDLANKFNISNLEPAEIIFKTNEENAFSKAGYDIIPRISNYYSVNDESIPFYFEIYQPNSKDTITVGLIQKVKNVKTQEEIESLSRLTRIELTEVKPIIRVLDILTLPSGDYELELTLLSKENKELAKTSYFFERFNNNFEVVVENKNLVIDPKFQASISNDSLKYYIASLIPIANPMEVKNIIKVLKMKNDEYHRKYIQAFWETLAEGKDAYEAWIKYKAQVQLVERVYHTTNVYGHATDRGRVYLRYGAPNNIITREISSAELPFEVWRYDKIQQYSNRKFIFYDPQLLGNYVLLHSDMYGEVKNNRWQQFLRKRNSYNTDVYNPTDGIDDIFGGKSGEFFNQY